jgi:hypothetical protein
LPLGILETGVDIKSQQRKKKKSQQRLREEEEDSGAGQSRFQETNE